jgi:uncharacterized protein (DUF362 family)/Pyruvate/2-oxoacid:ferredoxin oxidoreductase delta subunit
VPALVSHVRAEHGPGLPGHLERLVAPFGGWTSIVRPGERIAVKINLLRGAEPERAVCTHPETLRAVLRAIKAAGAEPFVADSPGGRNPPQKIARIWKLSGIADVCMQEHVELRDVENEGLPFPCPDGLRFRSFTVARSFVESHGIVQLGPLKTHQLMRLTGGVKLTFGCIPGLAKARLHINLPERDDFADMLLDLHLGLAPRFTIIDGIVAMQGQGPGGGTPCALGSLFAAHDAVALDAALADRTGHDRAEVYTLAAAERRGIIDLQTPYEAAGDQIAAEPGFVHAGRDLDARIPRRLRAAGRRLLTARPRVVAPSLCIRCGECAGICGNGACTLARVPIYDDDRCVRCYACVEVCPTGAIDAVNPPLVRLAERFRRQPDES